MRKHISIFIAAILMVGILTGFGMPAKADGDVTLSVTPEVTELTEPGVVNFTAAVTNSTTETLTSYAVMQGGHVKYDSAGATLVADDTNDSITFSVDVTEGMLDNPITFTVKYTTATLPLTEGGSDTVTIAKKELVTALNASYTSSQTIVNAGDIITFTFNLENLGETTLSNIVIKADALASGALNNEPFTLEPGETKSFSYEHTVSTIVTISPYIEYASNGVDQPDYELDVTELTSEERNVKVEFTVDNRNPEPGEEVTFTLTLRNEGTVPYTHLTVTYGGQDIGFSSTTLNPGEEKSQSYSMPFTVSTDVQFFISLVDHEGEIVPLSTGIISIQLPVDPDVLQNSVKLTLAPDVSQLSSAGTITFTGLISNNSEYILSDVSLTEDTLGSIPGIPDTIPANTPRNINFTADINETTTYNFVLTVHDRNGDTYKIQADPITVTVISAATSAPTYDDAADVTGEEITLDGDNHVDTLGIFAILAIVLVVLILGVGVALLILWRKGRRPKSGTARKSFGKRPTAKSSMKKKPRNPKSYRDRNNF